MEVKHVVLWYQRSIECWETLRRHLLLQKELEDANLAVTTPATELETAFSPVVTILSESWDLLGMRWQTRSKVRMVNLKEEIWEERLTAWRIRRVREQDLLSTSPLFFSSGLGFGVNVTPLTELQWC